MSLRRFACMVLLTVIAALSACSGGVGFGGRGEPVVDYFLVAGPVDDFAADAAGNAELQELARLFGENRAYYLGLYSQGGRFDSEITHITSGRVDSVRLRDTANIGNPDFEPLLAQGEISIDGPLAIIELPIPTADTALAAYTAVHLRGSFDVREAQAQIDELRGRDFGDFGSTDRIASTWTLNAVGPDGPLELRFSQLIRGFSHAYYSQR